MFPVCPADLRNDHGGQPDCPPSSAECEECGDAGHAIKQKPPRPLHSRAQQRNGAGDEQCRGVGILKEPRRAARYRGKVNYKQPWTEEFHDIDQTTQDRNDIERAEYFTEAEAQLERDQGHQKRSYELTFLDISFTHDLNVRYVE